MLGCELQMVAESIEDSWPRHPQWILDFWRGRGLCSPKNFGGPDAPPLGRENQPQDFPRTLRLQLPLPIPFTLVPFHPCRPSFLLTHLSVLLSLTCMYYDLRIRENFMEGPQPPDPPCALLIARPCMHYNYRTRRKPQTAFPPPPHPTLPPADCPVSACRGRTFSEESHGDRRPRRSLNEPCTGPSAPNPSMYCGHNACM